MDIRERHLALGASLAADGIPLHYGDQAAEYDAALNAAVLMERSHEGRLALTGRDRLDLLHRISTNDLLSLAEGEGRPTIFTNANARILDRATIYNRSDSAFVVTEPGRGGALLRYLQRNIFFNDDAQISDLTPSTRQFVIHGQTADAVLESLVPGLAATAPMHGQEAPIGDAAAFLARAKPLIGSNWLIVVANEHAVSVWDALLAAGSAHGLRPAGSLTYNALRIRAGRPGVGRELSSEYIPLEVGLWDEVSFHKGCYTGQEIIARMESRGRIARTIVALSLERALDAPAPITIEGREIGTLTSSVVTPTGEAIGLAVIRVAHAKPGTRLTAGNGIDATITHLPGAQPPMLLED